MTEQYKNDLSNWESKNIFLNDKEFSALQMSLVPIKTLYGNFETYLTQVRPLENQQWKHVILLPGTAFKFPNKLNAEYTVKSILSIMQIKNIPTKIHILSHRVNPVYPQAETDTLEMLQILIEEEKFKQFSILTWSAGCSFLQKVFAKTKELGCKVNRICMISPVVDFQNKKREKKADFLNQDFFEFIEKFYCGGDLQKVNSLSLMNGKNKKAPSSNIISTPLSIVYGSEEYIREDIEQYIKQVNQAKRLNRQQNIDTKIFLNENHALLSFVTSAQNRQNEKAMNKISKTKWLVSKYVADFLQREIQSKENNSMLASPFVVPQEIKCELGNKN